MQSTMQYVAPLDIDLSPELRAETYKQQRVKDATNWAKKAAKLYATVLVRRQESDFNCKDVVSDVGGEIGEGAFSSMMLMKAMLKTWVPDRRGIFCSLPHNLCEICDDRMADIIRWLYNTCKQENS